jgi:hypothetical protein
LTIIIVEKTMLKSWSQESIEKIIYVDRERYFGVVVRLPKDAWNFLDGFWCSSGPRNRWNSIAFLRPQLEVDEKDDLKRITQQLHQGSAGTP